VETFSRLTLPQLIHDVAESCPESEALVAGSARLTYKGLDELSRRVAGAFIGLGAAPGQRVGLLCTNSWHWPVAAIGAMTAGARVDAFNTWVKAWDLEYLLTTSECSVLVISSHVKSTDLLVELKSLLPELWDSPVGEWTSSRFPALRSVVVIGSEAPQGAFLWDELIASAEGVSSDYVRCLSEDTAFVMYTSGTTSRPKAVPLIHRDLIANSFQIGERIGLTSTDRVWLTSPLFWSFGGANAMMATFTHSACLVLQEYFNPEDALGLIRDERCTTGYLLPSIAESLSVVAPDIAALGHLRKGVTIGRPDEIRRVIEELGVSDVCNVYGSTEVYGNCCVTPHDADLNTRITSQGPPLDGVEIRVVDDEGLPIGIDKPGELQVRGRVMSGYLSQVSNGLTLSFTSDGWFQTGDRARIDARGYMYFLARETDMIKTSGINISPAEVEAFLSQHPLVSEVVVVGAPHPTRDQVAVAFATTNGQVSGSDLRQFCKEGIADYKVPYDVVILEKLPQTDTGKVTRNELSQLAAHRVEEIIQEQSKFAGH